MEMVLLIAMIAGVLSFIIKERDRMEHRVRVRGQDGSPRRSRRLRG